MNCPKCFNTGKQIDPAGRKRRCDCPWGALDAGDDKPFSYVGDLFIIGVILVLLGIVVYRSLQ